MTDDALDLFIRERPRLLRVAYRLLGSARDAEDVLQDAWLRWVAASHDEIASPQAFLTTLVSRLAIDAMRSAHARRMEYVGQWLPEPIVADAFAHFVDDPVARTEVADELALAAMLLLERLSPAERAVFVLRESLDFSFAEIAQVVGRSESSCRQLDRRARQRLSTARRRQPVEAADLARLLDRFLGAVRGGDVEGLLQLLSDDCVSVTDGGGMPGVSRNVIDGADRVARFFVGLGRKAPAETTWRIADVNGQPGLLTFVGGVLHNVIAIDVVEGRITQFFITVNPKKLRLS